MRIVNGDSAAEAELAERFQRPLFSMLLNRVRDADTARDLVQEVFVAALPALRRRQLQEGSKLAAFLHGIAKNVANEFLRRATRRPAHLEIADGDSWLDGRHQAEASARLMEVQQALDELAADDRKLLFMTLVEGRKPGEVAISLGLTSETVRTRKTRALRRLVERVSLAVTKSSP